MQMLAEQYPITQICDILDCARSTYYHQAVAADEQPLQQAITAVAGEWPRYGYRRITKQLQRQGWTINHKRMERIMRELGLQARRKSHRKVLTTTSAHAFPRYPNLVEQLEIVRPEQVWVCDITYIRLLEEFVYLAVLMDVFTRGIRGWHLGRSLDQSLTLRALEQALAQHTPDIHHSDQAVQYAATAYTERLQAAGVQISMAEVGAAWQNGYAERLMRTIKEEEVDLADYVNYAMPLGKSGAFSMRSICTSAFIPPWAISLPPSLKANGESNKQSTPSFTNDHEICVHVKCQLELPAHCLTEESYLERGGCLMGNLTLTELFLTR